MKYLDKIYGEFEIKEPVVLELINSPSLQRLKYVDQAGYQPLFVKPDVKMGGDHTRFAHSVGVYLLLYKYRASIEEQIAGLIHDVSHSAFSHCIDYVLESGSQKEQNSQDNFFEEYVKKTEIPAILEKYGFDPGYILNEEKFPLKEKKLPDLCADRIDYSLKEAMIFEELDEKTKNYFLDNLIVKDDSWVFLNFESAKKFAVVFFTMNSIYYSAFESAVMFRTVGDYLKYSLQKGYLSQNDLYTTDQEVLDKANKCFDKDEKLKLLWLRMNGKIKVKNNPKDYDAEVFCKSRAVDPLFSDGGALKRVSDFEPSWGETVKQELKPKQYFLKFDR
ncbi:MAG: HD domain-containing protein [Patescibacteria group bacterium]